MGSESRCLTGDDDDNLYRSDREYRHGSFCQVPHLSGQIQPLGSFVITDIIEEHLEEASWLYDMRQTLLSAYDINLRTLKGWDERWLAHVDGLVTGGAHSREVVVQALNSNDAGAV